MKQLAILLATYNGARYLRPLLDSLFAQTEKRWTLYVHDDGSADETLDILNAYAAAHPNMVLLDYPPTGGAKNNFLSLLERTAADFYMFCDQDDVWAERKVERTLEKMLEAEEQFSAATPIVVHCDLFVTDEGLNVTSPSFWQCEHIDALREPTFSQLAACNLLTGCAMMLNAAAKAVVPTSAPLAKMHDAWIAACVVWKKGKIIPIAEPLIYYRQHGGNVLGVNSETLGQKLQHVRRVFADNAAQYRMMNAAGHISAAAYVWAKLRYLIRKH